MIGEQAAEPIDDKDNEESIQSLASRTQRNINRRRTGS